MTELKDRIKILKRADDRIAVRISMGWSMPATGSDFGYIVYRGNLKEVKQVFKKLYEAIMQQKGEAEIDPKYGFKKV